MGSIPASSDILSRDPAVLKFAPYQILNAGLKKNSLSHADSLDFKGFVLGQKI